MRYFIILTVSISIIIPAVGFSQTTWYVPDDFPTIQGAISDLSVVDEDTIIVRAGTYVENIDFLGKAITVTSEQGAGNTIIDGNQSGSVVVFINGEGLDSQLDGFTLTNGSGTYIQNSGQWVYIGGGIYCYDASPTIMNNIFTSNLNLWAGGGLYGHFNSSMICNNTFINNTADYGGALFFDESSPQITNNVIKDNKVNLVAGGIWIEDYKSSPIIDGNLIIDNTAKGGAGAIQMSKIGSATILNNLIAGNTSGYQYWTSGSVSLFGVPSATIANNIFYGNLADEMGGAIDCGSSTIANIVNNTIYGNSAQKGGAISCQADSIATISNTIFWDNDAPEGPEIWIGGKILPSTVNISYSDLKGGQSSVHIEKNCTLNWGAGMIDSDPLFIDQANGDLHLTFNSPCRGSGDNSSVTELYDFEGDPRIAYGTVDMGADEFYTHLYWTGNATPGGNVDVKFVGLPGISPVGLCIGTGVLDPPLKSMWGDWYLKFPIFGPMDMGSITSPEGVLIIPVIIPATPPAPYSIPMQALIGAELSNLSMLEVK